ncbi:MAG: glycosyltransferase family 4 protein [Candidatus Dormibacteria bacterium]
MLEATVLMRIALIAPLVSPIADPPEGGSQAVIADLARGLVQRGHEVVLYASQGSRVGGVEVVCLEIDSRLLREDTYRHGMATTPSAAMACAYRQVYAAVGRSEWDVVHSHGFDPPAVTEPARAGVAVLHTLHLPPTGAMVTALGEARDGGTTTWCVAVSHAHAAAWGEVLAMDGVVPNGVPVAEIPFGAAGSGRAVVAARFSHEKGVDESIAAARQAGCPVDVYAGPYDRECESAVLRRWAGDDEVRFHGPAARARLWAAFSGAGVVACLARWDEPFGMVAAEAQAAGAPVVATRRGGLAEIVRDGVTGYLVPPDDQDAAAAALGRVGDLDRHACRRHAAENLSIESSVARHEELYMRFRAASRAVAVARP